MDEDDDLIVIQCAYCEDFFNLTKDEDPGHDPYFCEAKPCVQAAFRHHVGGPF
jgi:hypothetical protein